MNSKKSQGLGDTIQKITKATGIEKVVKKVLGDDCGCDERKEKLNKLFPYSRVMNKNETELWETHLKDWQTFRSITAPQQRMCLNIFNACTNRKVKFSRCAKCVKKLFQDTDKIYQNSCDEVSH